MTIASEQGRQTYFGDGVSTAFPVPWKFFDNGDLTVILQSLDGVDTELTEGLHYTLTGAGDESGGELTMLTPPANLLPLTVLLDPRLLQGIDYVNNDSFPAESHERALDRLTQQSIRTRDIVGRTIRLPDGDRTSLSTLPGAAARANKLFGFGANGDIELIVTLAVGQILSRSVIGQFLWDITPAEAAAGLTTAMLTFGEMPYDVRRYGAVGNGIADDSTAFLRGLLACAKAGERMRVRKPSAYYRIVTPLVVPSLDANLLMDIDDGAEIRYVGANTNYLLHVQATNGHDVIMQGGFFNQNLKAARAIRIDNESASMADANIGKAVFRRARCENGYLYVGGTQAASGILCHGGFSEVIFDDPTVRNMNRATGSGDPGQLGCYGLAVVHNDINGYCPQVKLIGGIIDTITNSEATGDNANVDCDGVIHSVPTAAENGGFHVAASFESKGTTFKDCKGRNVKTQIDGFTIIKDFVEVRKLEEAIGNCRGFDCQRGGGEITGACFWYEKPGGGTTLGASHAFALFGPDQGATSGDSADGGFRVGPITVYNHIPRATDQLPYFVLVANDNPARKLIGVSMEKCVMNGGRLSTWIQHSGGTAAESSISIADCEGDVTGALLSFTAAVDDSCKLFLSGNRQTQPANTAKLVSLVDDNEPFIYGGDNSGWVKNYLTRSSASTVGQASRPGLIAGDTEDGHGFVPGLALTLADDASGIFPAVGLYGKGEITNNFNALSQAVFTHNSADCVAVVVSTAVAYGTGNANPDTDGKLNVWIDTNGCINIKNRLGSTRSFYLTHNGGL